MTFRTFLFPAPTPIRFGASVSPAFNASLTPQQATQIEAFQAAAAKSRFIYHGISPVPITNTPPPDASSPPVSPRPKAPSPEPEPDPYPADQLKSDSIAPSQRAVHPLLGRAISSTQASYAAYCAQYMKAIFCPPQHPGVPLAGRSTPTTQLPAYSPQAPTYGFRQSPSCEFPDEVPPGIPGMEPRQEKELTSNSEDIEESSCDSEITDEDLQFLKLDEGQTASAKSVFNTVFS